MSIVYLINITYPAEAHVELNDTISSLRCIGIERASLPKEEAIWMFYFPGGTATGSIV